MKTVLLLVFGVIAFLFVIGFLMGAWKNFSSRGKKYERAQAAILLAQIPRGAFGVLLLVFGAFRLNDPNKANAKAQSHPAEIADLLGVLNRPRDPAFSAGRIGDEANLGTWMTSLSEQGYAEPPAAIIAFVFHHRLDGMLDEIARKGRYRSLAPLPTSSERGEDASRRRWT